MGEFEKPLISKRRYISLVWYLARRFEVGLLIN
jgi:hypothetical protein